MASSGGHWVKYPQLQGGGSISGQMIFVPKPGTAYLYHGEGVHEAAVDAIIHKTELMGIGVPGAQSATQQFVADAKAAFGLQGGSQAGQGINKPKKRLEYHSVKPSGQGYYSSSSHFSKLTGKTSIKVDGGGAMQGVKTGHGFSMIFNSNTGNYHVLNKKGQSIQIFQSSKNALDTAKSFTQKWETKLQNAAPKPKQATLFGG